MFPRVALMQNVETQREGGASLRSHSNFPRGKGILYRLQAPGSRDLQTQRGETRYAPALSSCQRGRGTQRRSLHCETRSLRVWQLRNINNALIVPIVVHDADGSGPVQKGQSEAEIWGIFVSASGARSVRAAWARTQSREPGSQAAPGRSGWRPRKRWLPRAAAAMRRAASCPKSMRQKLRLGDFASQRKGTSRKEGV